MTRCEFSARLFSRALSGGCGSRGLALISRLDEPQVESQTAEPVSVLSFITRADPPGGDAVRSVPAVAQERRGPAVRAWLRPLLRNGTALVEPVRPDVRRRDPAQAGKPHARVSALAVAS